MGEKYQTWERERGMDAGKTGKRAERNDGGGGNFGLFEVHTIK